MTITKVNQETIQSANIKSKNNSIVLGLERGEVGFVIGPPGTGKSRLCLSIAYELATQVKLLDITEHGSKPLKTLLIPFEEGKNTVLKKIGEHFSEIKSQFQALVTDHVAIWEPSKNMQKDLNDNITKNQLIDDAKNYDLLIIDTIRRSFPFLDEVKDDKLIGNTLREIAEKSKSTVIGIHHPVKEIARGNTEVNSVSASGLSVTMSDSRWILYIEPPSKKNNKSIIKHIKANNLSPEEYLNRDLQMSKFGVLFSSEEADNLFGASTEKPKAIRKDKNDGPPEPIIIERNTNIVSDEDDNYQLELHKKLKEALKNKK